MARSRPHMRSLRWRAAVPLLGGTLVAVGAGCCLPLAGAATASPAARARPDARLGVALRTAPLTNVFCSDAENASKNSTATAEQETPASLVAAFDKLKSEEPLILSKVPSQIKGDYETLFNYFNKFYAELASVKYDFLKLPPSYLATLEKSAAPVEAASKAIATYVSKTCGVAAK